MRNDMYTCVYIYGRQFEVRDDQKARIGRGPRELIYMYIYAYIYMYYVYICVYIYRRQAI
jgi:hypothetical protein